ncbi:MAG TPA: CRISPR-associated protein Csx16 [Vicinamibacterales bacterium]|nr:CRISPR-associated protein Csx16 [Vicinamibacterales bacterium]
MRTIVVTRHMALVRLLIERRVVPPDVRVIPHVGDPDEVAGQHVVLDEALPLHIAARAASVTEVPLALAPEDRRGNYLTLARLRQIAGAPRTYVVREIDDGGLTCW